jgi:hypothetical protein
MKFLANGKVAVGSGVTANELLTLGGVFSLKETTAPTQTANYGKLYVKSSDSKLYFMDDSGAETNLISGGGAVSTVFGRSGAVVATSGDYTASQVTNVAAGNLAATTAQAAINELDTEKLAKAGDTMTGNLVMNAQKETRYADSDSSNYAALRAPATITTNFTLTLPDNDGASGDVLVTDGSGNLSWVQQPTGAGDITAVTTAVGSGLTGGNTTGAIALALDFGTGADQVQKNSSIYNACGTGQKLQMNPGPTYSWTCVNVGALQDADGDTKIQVEESANDNMIRFDIAGSEMATVDNSGVNVVGSVNAQYANIEGAGATVFPGATVSAVTTSGQPEYILKRARGTVLGSPQAVNDLDDIGLFRARAYNGTQIEDAATVRFIVDGTNVTGSGGHLGGRIDFSVRGTSDTSQYTAGDPAMTIRNTKKVGINTTNPNEVLTVEGVTSFKETTAPSQTANYGKLYVKSSDSKLYFMDDSGAETNLLAGGGASQWTTSSSDIYYSTGNVGIGTAPAAEKLEVSGNVLATAYLHSSDRRLKTDIHTMSGLDVIRQLRGVHFKWRTDMKDDMGFIAQEVEEVLPELVHTNPKTGIKAVKYDALTSPLVEAVKELDNMCRLQENSVKKIDAKLADQDGRVKELEAQVKKLKNDNDELKQRLERLEKAILRAPASIDKKK